MDPVFILVAAIGFAIRVLISWKMETVYQSPFTFSPASFYGVIDGTTLDVGRVMSARMRPGDIIEGDHVTSCVIRSIDTGTRGPGKSTVSRSQPVRPRPLMTATPGLQLHELGPAGTGPP